MLLCDEEQKDEEEEETSGLGEIDSKQTNQPANQPTQRIVEPHDFINIHTLH